MSDPTYRIDVEHDPGSEWPWKIHVVRLSDERYMHSIVHYTKQEGIEEVQAWIAAQNVRQPTVSLFVDDDGRPVEGHSVKA